MKVKLPINRADDERAYNILRCLIDDKQLTWKQIHFIRDLNVRVKSITLEMVTIDNFSLITDIIGKLAMIDTLY